MSTDETIDLHATRNDTGNLCGYVGLPPSHPAHGKDYGDLGGVGAGEVIEHTKIVAFHARRRLSDAEIERLDPAWRAIDPVDMG